MRGVDHQQSGMFSYISAERRVPRDHPLRAIRVMVDAALKESSWRFDAVYASSGRPSIPPEKLLRALLLQMLYTVRSERLLMEQLDYNLLFRWFVGLSMDDRIWDPTVFTKNRNRLLRGHIAVLFFEQMLAEARERAAECRKLRELEIDPIEARETAMRQAALERAKSLKFAQETDVPLKAHTFPHPFPIFGTLNAYQWLLYIPAHNLRHDKQIAEIMSNPKFPEFAK